MTCIGFMTITKDSANPGMTDAKFVYMVSDDGTQDAQMVISGKCELYKNHLPSFITQAKFQSDGAGCFSTSLHFLLQPAWKAWTSIDEISTRHTPAGGGKEVLDGGFG
jgi:hypothetical protein